MSIAVFIIITIGLMIIAFLLGLFLGSKEEPMFTVEEPVTKDLHSELSELLDRHGSNYSDTPDYVLARYLLDCLIAFNNATRQRERIINSKSKKHEVQQGVL